MDFTQIVYDARHAFRRLRRTPAFTVTALTVLALGIAVNVAVFSAANAVLFRPPAFPDPDRLVAFQTTSRGGVDPGASPVMYEVWRNQAGIVQDVAAVRQVPLNDTTGTPPEQIRASLVSADYFRLFGAGMARGRAFTEQEDRPGSAPVAILSHGMWIRRFGGRDVIGQVMSLNGVPHTVIGVVDAAFHAEDLGPAPDAWLPIRIDSAAKTQGHFFAVYGRLRPGVSVLQARAQLRLATEDFRRQFPSALSADAAFNVEAMREALTRNARPLFVVLLGAVGFVLLIACANVAILHLLQGTIRQQEIAIRAAIGAARERIVRQLLLESLLLSVSAGGIGLAFAWLATRALPALGVAGIPRLDDVTAATIDGRVAAFAIAVSIGTGILFGLAPALRLSRPDLGAMINSADGRATQARGRRTVEAALVVVQISLALVLLVGSGLFMRTVIALIAVDPGFDADHVLTLRASLDGPQVRTTPDSAAIVRRGADALRTVPGVATVGASYGLPLENGFGLPFEIVGRPLPPGAAWHGGASWLAVSPGYFEALAIPLKRGRTFKDEDRRQGPAVAIINDVLARQQWPYEDPIGKRIVLGHGTGPQFQDEPVREIVGVVGSIRESRLDAAPGAEVYEPQAQLPDVANAFVAGGTSMAWIVRTTLPPGPLGPTLQRSLQESIGLPVWNVRPMQEIVRHSIVRQRFAAWLMGAFGLTALLLAAIGLYGLVAYSVAQRTREIGIRLALGAEPSRVKRMVIGQGLRLAAAGATSGVLAALLLTRVIARLLFNVRAWDPATLAGGLLVIVGVAMVAVWVPARRASRVDPMVALRYE